MEEKTSRQEERAVVWKEGISALLFSNRPFFGFLNASRSVL